MMMLFFFKVVPFVPFLFIVYSLCRFLVGRASVYVVLTLIVVLFLLYGYLIWRGEFFYIYQFDRPNYSFRKWWAVETGELHFNIASFVSTFYFVWMTFYRNNKPKMREVNKTYVNAE